MEDTLRKMPLKTNEEVNSPHERARRLYQTWMPGSVNTEAINQLETILAALDKAVDFAYRWHQYATDPLVSQLIAARNIGRGHVHTRNCWEDPGPAHGSPYLICSKEEGELEA